FQYLPKTSTETLKAETLKWMTGRQDDWTARLGDCRSKKTKTCPFRYRVFDCPNEGRCANWTRNILMCNYLIKLEGRGLVREESFVAEKLFQRSQNRRHLACYGRRAKFWSGLGHDARLFGGQ